MSRAFIDRSHKTVGREREIAALRSAIAGARSGHGGCVVLIGEAGYGKTRLLHAAASIASSEQMSVLAGAAPDAIAPPPYGTIAAAFRSWTRTGPEPADELRPLSAGIQRILPEWLDRGSATDPDSDQLRLLVLEAAVRLMLVAARPNGAVVILDDLHGADPETIEIVQHAAGSISEHPVLLVVAMRPDQPGPAERETRVLAQQGRAAIVDVLPLDRNGTAAMIGSILDAKPSPKLVDEVFRRTDGSPLLIEELLETYAAADALSRDDAEITLTSAGRPLVPPTIVQSVRRRLASLSEHARRMVGAAAVVGRVDEQLLAYVSDLEPAVLTDAIEEAVAAGLLDPAGGFRHALIMEAAAEALVPMRKKEFHARAAEALSELFHDPTRSEERARHLEAIGRTEDAAAALLAAADRSLGVFAPGSAEAALRRALALDPPPQLQAALTDRLAQALTALGRWETALQIDREAAAPPEDATRLMRMARNALRSSRLDEADALISRSQELGGRAGPIAALAGLVALWRGEYERAVTLASAALSRGEREGDIEVICDALDVAGRGKDGLGRRDEAIADFRRWESEARRGGMTASRVQALMEIGNVEYMRDGSPATLRQVRKEAKDAGTFTTLVLADLSLTWCLGSAGELDEALECAEEATDYCRRFGLDLLPHALNALGWTMGRRVPHSGETACTEAGAIAAHDGDAQVCMHEIRADSLLRTGRYAEAVEHYDRGWELLRSGSASLPAMTPFVRVCALAASGRWSQARDAMQEARQHPAATIVSVNSFWLDAAEALVANDADALDHVLSPERTPAALERAIAATLAGDIVDAPAAPGWIRDALIIFERAGAETDAARARALLRRHGAPVPRARGATQASAADLRDKGITRREAEVLELVGKGLSNPEIADKLYVSIRTVESHVSSLLSKLALESRPALIAFAISRERPSSL